MPKGMGVAAKRMWRKWTRQLIEVGVMSIVDGTALEQACVSAALAEKFYREALVSPMVNEFAGMNEETGEIYYKRKINPAALGYIAASKNVKSYLIEFGLTPASRSKLKIEKEQPDNELPTKEQTTLPETELDLGSIDETTVN